MPSISLKYGRTSIHVTYNERRFEVLGQQNESLPLSDAEIGSRLDAPINCPPLEDIVEPGETVLLVVPDATRQTACGQIVNLVVRRLIANGTAPHDIRTIFATGIHRKVAEEEKAAILTPFIAQRIKAIDHDPRDLANIVRLGATGGGIPVELNRALVEHDRVIIIGGVTFHYFAGFTGGRKLICPGLASARTILETHKLAFDCETKSRRNGVGTGLLDGNAVHEAFVEAASKIQVSFAISTIVNDAGAAVDVFCGDWMSSHRSACDAYAARHTVRLAGKRGLVIASCGGYPFDINLIQAHKALEGASKACRDGGTIIFLAECADGLGKSDLLKWFDVRDSNALAAMLCDKYQVNGQTAWSLLRKAERFDVKMATTLDEIQLSCMRLKKIDPREISSRSAALTTDGYIVPNGARFMFVE